MNHRLKRRRQALHQTHHHYYLNISVEAANLSDWRIESKLFARIGMLYCPAHCYATDVADAYRVSFGDDAWLVKTLVFEAEQDHETATAAARERRFYDDDMRAYSSPCPRHRHEQLASTDATPRPPLTPLLVSSLCFLPRDAMQPRYTSHGPVSARLCLSVCLSQVGVLLKRLNVGSHKQHHTIAQGL